MVSVCMFQLNVVVVPFGCKYVPLLFDTLLLFFGCFSEWGRGRHTAAQAEETIVAGGEQWEAVSIFPDEVCTKLFKLTAD